MFGLDDRIAELSHGASIGVVLLVAAVLGLRHATDPDHIAAVATLVASGRERVGRSAARLGVWWGLGHATTLVAFGVPILLFDAYLPDVAQQSAETLVALVIVALAVRLLVRSRRGSFHLHAHDEPEAHRHTVRTPSEALGIGLVHGMGGSAGVGVLLLAAVPSRTVAIAALVLLALFTAVSMAVVTSGFGAALARGARGESMLVAAPAFGLLSLGFGLWYAAAAWSLAPYPF
ncbi:MAG TPA: hypothetical protein VH572_05930 [Gaiella sp.]|jgi:hypothetical protein